MCKLVYIRTADIKDRDNIWPLARDFASSFVLDRTCFDASFDLLVTRPDTLLLIAERSQDDVIGYLLTFGHATFLANGPVTWVEEIMVAEQARRTGVGRKLMEAAEVGAHPPAPPTSLWQRGDQPLSTARSVIKTRRRTSERCFRPSLSEGRPLEAKSRSRSRDQIKIKNEVGPGGRWGATP